MRSKKDSSMVFSKCKNCIEFFCIATWTNKQKAEELVSLSIPFSCK